MTTFTLELPGDLPEEDVQAAVDIAVEAVRAALLEAGTPGELVEVEDGDTTEEEDEPASEAPVEDDTDEGTPV